MTALALLLIAVTAGTSGELCLARTMKQIGEVTDFRPAALLQILGAAFHIRWTWLALVLLATYLAAILSLLSVGNVSAVIPMTALSYVIGPIGGRFFLGEQVARARWLGVALVCVGVALVFWGS